uniref:Uncharacterized protein n=1 Tax=Rhizophora mucronata TaxID=61149 RepID=A0A2P2P823_RHIMU
MATAISKNLVLARMAVMHVKRCSSQRIPRDISYCMSRHQDANQEIFNCVSVCSGGQSQVPDSFL